MSITSTQGPHPTNNPPEKKGPLKKLGEKIEETANSVIEYAKEHPVATGIIMTTAGPAAVGLVGAAATSAAAGAGAIATTGAAVVGATTSSAAAAATGTAAAAATSGAAAATGTAAAAAGAAGPSIFLK